LIKLVLKFLYEDWNKVRRPLPLTLLKEYLLLSKKYNNILVVGTMPKLEHKIENALIKVQLSGVVGREQCLTWLKLAFEIIER